MQHDGIQVLARNLNAVQIPSEKTIIILRLIGDLGFHLTTHTSRVIDDAHRKVSSIRRDDVHHNIILNRATFSGGGRHRIGLRSGNGSRNGHRDGGTRLRSFNTRTGPRVSNVLIGEAFVVGIQGNHFTGADIVVRGAHLEVAAKLIDRVGSRGGTTGSGRARNRIGAGNNSIDSIVVRSSRGSRRFRPCVGIGRRSSSQNVFRLTFANHIVASDGDSGSSLHRDIDRIGDGGAARIVRILARHLHLVGASSFKRDIVIQIRGGAHFDIVHKPSIGGSAIGSSSIGITLNSESDHAVLADQVVLILSTRFQSQFDKSRICTNNSCVFLNSVRVTDDIVINTGNPDAVSCKKVSISNHVFIRSRSSNKISILEPLVSHRSSTGVQVFSNEGSVARFANLRRQSKTQLGNREGSEIVDRGGSLQTAFAVHFNNELMDRVDFRTLENLGGNELIGLVGVHTRGGLAVDLPEVSLASDLGGSFDDGGQNNGLVGTCFGKTNDLNRKLRLSDRNRHGVGGLGKSLTTHLSIQRVSARIET